MTILLNSQFFNYLPYSTLIYYHIHSAYHPVASYGCYWFLLVLGEYY